MRNVVYWMHENFTEDKYFNIVQCKYFAPDHRQLINNARDSNIWFNYIGQSCVLVFHDVVIPFNVVCKMK